MWIGKLCAPRDEKCMAHYLTKWGLDSGRCGDIHLGDVPLDIVNCDDCSFEESGF